MYKDIIHFFVLSCHKVTYLMEKQRHTKLLFKERIQLKLHLSLCGYCAGYSKEADFIDLAIRRVIREKCNVSENGFSEVELQRFRKHILSRIADKEAGEK